MSNALNKGIQPETIMALRDKGIYPGRYEVLGIDSESKAQEVLGEGGRDVGNITEKFDTNNILNMTKQDIIDNIPNDWNYTDHNRFIHIRDADGKGRIRIEPPDRITDYPHVHVYDINGKILDSFDNIVDRKSPDGHIPYKDN